MKSFEFYLFTKAISFPRVFFFFSFINNNYVGQRYLFSYFAKFFKFSSNINEKISKFTLMHLLFKIFI